MRSSFNDDWSFRPKQNMFLGLSGGGEPWQAVRLPHDAMLTGERRPDAPAATGYYPGGVWEYTKTFRAPEEWRDQRVTVLFEGAYRSAQVYVNDDLAGGRPFGYSEFAIALDPFLRVGEDNTIRVELRAGDDSRWYSGAGLYRNVHLIVTPLVHLALDGVVITTPEIDGNLAVVAVSAQVANETSTDSHCHGDVRGPRGWRCGRRQRLEPGHPPSRRDRDGSTPSRRRQSAPVARR